MKHLTVKNGRLQGFCLYRSQFEFNLGSFLIAIPKLWERSHRLFDGLNISILETDLDLENILLLEIELST